MNTILERLSKGEITLEQAQKEMATAEAKKQPPLTLKVSTKGALSVYGMGRWPVTLYRQQWERLLSKSDEIKGFIAKHASQLTTKGETGGEFSEADAA